MPYEYPWEKTTTIKILNMTVTLRSFLVCVSFLLPSSQPQATADIFPITLDWFRFCRILCKWNHAVHAFDFSVWRLSHIIIILTLIRVVQVQWWVLLHCWVEFHCMVIWVYLYTWLASSFYYYKYINVLGIFITSYFSLRYNWHIILY